jgi:NADH-quinone oxidoreductase subunit G
MTNLTIDDLDIITKKGLSIIEVCNSIGIKIPRFCYHELLPTAGNCRMCLVEIDILHPKDEEKDDTKLFASCTTEIGENMVINTCSEHVIKTREDIIEMLLLNHPLDCPICDQAGECDLQDQSKAFGIHKSKFFFNRRAVEEKICGPVIKTIMTRCIHCTRCVRFFNELEGTAYLGTFNRGGVTEIGNYVSKSIDSEISGNVIDLCPVGALTSNVYAFQARPWELTSCESIDTSDSLGSNIYIYSRDSEIYRILPKQNNEINKSIISDKTRFSFDYNRNNRINNIYTKKEYKNLVKTKWNRFLFDLEKILILNTKILFYVDENIDLINLNILNQISYKDNKKFNIKNISSLKEYSNFYSRTLTDRICILNESKELIFFFFSNSKKESTILNTLIKIENNSNFIEKVFSFGLFFSNNLNIKFINLKNESFLNVFESKNKSLSKELLYKNSLFIIGSNFLKLISSLNFTLYFMKNKINRINIINISKQSNTNGIILLNIKNINSKNINLSSLHVGINLDDVYKTRKYFNKINKNSIWCNTHFSKFSLNKDNIVPILTPFEQEEIHLNLENRPQKTEKAVSNNFETRSLEILLNFINNNKKNNLNFINYLIEEVYNSDLFNLNEFSFVKNFLKVDLENLSVLSRYPIKSDTQNFYCSNKNTRNSLAMISFYRDKINNFNNFI